MKRFIGRRSVRKLSWHSKKFSNARVTYSGSPDSEVVASYIEKFDFRPAKRSQIQKKYADLISSAHL